MDGAEMAVEIESALGGRWRSLRGRNGREWLWRRDAPRRAFVMPGDAFVDAGGLEECLPTIAGVPDHGDAWSRPWTESDGGWMSVEGQEFRLARRITTGGLVTAEYRLEADPGWRFIWAGHALVDLAEGAVVDLPRGSHIWVNAAGSSTPTVWPDYHDHDLSVLGPDDGSALMIIVPWVDSATVRDGHDALTLSVAVEGQPYGISVWRNLGGFPEQAPYRNIGIEPMVGYCPTLSLAGPEEAAVVPPSGVVEWSLTIDG